MREEWRPVVGFEGLYEVSDMGNVRSLDRQVKMIGRWGTEEVRSYRARQLKTHECPNGYVRVVLSVSSKLTTRTVHSLVAEAFLGPVPEGQEVRHKNGRANQNRLENLIYGTRSQNRDDSRRHGTLACGERIAQSKITADDARAIRAAKGRMETIADAFGISRSQVRRIKQRENWAHV